MNLPRQRLYNQCITRPRRGRIADLVAWLGAVQAQEYPFAAWALALRLTRDLTFSDVERAFDAGEILRTHVLRPTWHFVAAEDIGWMLELTAPRVLATLTSYTRHRSLSRPLLVRAASIFERALGGQRHLTRRELGAELAKARIEMTPLQLALTTMYAELERVICSGPRRGKQFTYALLAERARAPRSLSRDESLAELTRRYFGSHGPATVRDFVWWSGLKTADARRGLEMIQARSADRDGLTYWHTAAGQAPDAAARRVHLLPIYDEYLVAYRDRAAVPHHVGSGKPSTSVSFRHSLIVDGQVAGSWKVESGAVPAVHVTPVRTLNTRERREVESAVARYRQFLIG